MIEKITKLNFLGMMVESVHWNHKYRELKPQRMIVNLSSPVCTPCYEDLSVCDRNHNLRRRQTKIVQREIKVHTESVRGQIQVRHIQLLLNWVSDSFPKTNILLLLQAARKSRRHFPNDIERTTECYPSVIFRPFNMHDVRAPNLVELA